jgi:lipopolysaccharide export system protein LptA
MRRLIGTKVNDETTGPLIVYDQSNDTFTVNGSTLPPDASVAAGAAGGRVRAVLTPRAPASAAGGAKPAPPASGAGSGSSSSSGSGSGSAPAAAPSATSPATPPAGSGLRQSTTLGGEPRK